jgi:hypothetical protein
VIGAVDDYSGEDHTSNTTSDDDSPSLQMNYSEDSSDDDDFGVIEALALERITHFGSTVAVVGFCYIAAISVPGVGFVWSLIGSSMAILIAFVVPAACYLKIRVHKRMNPRSILAWALLLISCVAAPICTQQALISNMY